MIGSDANALASSVVLVCRKRAANAADRHPRRILRALSAKCQTPSTTSARPASVPSTCSNRSSAPAWACSRAMRKVLENDDSPMSVQDGADADQSRLGGNRERTRRRFRSRDPGRAGMVRHLRLRREAIGRTDHARQRQEHSPGGAVLLRRVQEPARQAGADRRAPSCRRTGRRATDKQPTVWECVQHTARVLAAADGGAAAAACWSAQMGREGRGCPQARLSPVRDRHEEGLGHGGAGLQRTRPGMAASRRPRAQRRRARRRGGTGRYVPGAPLR